MNKDLLLNLFDSVNINNILQTSSESTLNEELVNYVIDKNKKLTVINKNLKLEKEPVSNIIIKKIDLLYQLPLESNFDIILLQDLNYSLYDQLRMLRDNNTNFPITIIYYNNISLKSSLDNYKNEYADKDNNIFNIIKKFQTESTETYTFKILDYYNEVAVLYKSNLDLSDKIDSISKTYDFNIEDVQDDYFEHIEETMEISKNIDEIKSDISYIKQEKEQEVINQKEYQVVGVIDSYKNNGILTGWLADIGSNEEREVNVIIDGQIFQIIANEPYSLKSKGILGDHGFILNIPNQFRDGNLHYVKLVDNESQKIVASTNILFDKNLELIHKMSSHSDDILKQIYEAQYYRNDHRSFKQRAVSSLYPISLLLHTKRLGGLKRAIITIKGFRSIKKQNLFDIGYYLLNKPDLRLNGNDVLLHYIYNGYNEGLKPNQFFDGKEYLKVNPDIKNMGLNPLIHYSLYGKNEKRPIVEQKKISQDKKPKQIAKKVITSNKKEDYHIKGTFQSDIKDTMLSGWMAEIGNNTPQQVIIDIDGEKFETIANLYRPDLKQNGVNEGNHAFKFQVPDRFVDGEDHTIKLKDSKGYVLQTIRHKWNKPEYENNIQRYFANAMTSPEIVLPLKEPDKKILSVLDNIANYLTKQVPEKEPLVSIIMPVYNRANIIPNAIFSVLNQTYHNLELIIVDDGSTDKTVQQIKRFDDNRIKLICNEKQNGVSTSRNNGLKVAKGKYIMYLDSDNDWDERYVAATVGAFIKNKDADAVYSGQLIYVGNRDNLESIRFGTLNKGLLKNKNYVDLNAYAHTREIYEKYGGFDEELKRFVDWDLILKYVTYGKTYSIPMILSNYYYEIVENAISNNTKLGNFIEQVTNKQMQRLNNKEYDKNMDHNVSVIIPSYESLPDLKECINALLDLDATWLEIVVVDNNSHDNVKNYLKMLESENKIKLILNDRNFGFTYAVNQGIELSNPKNDIVLLNNDAIVTKGSIESLQHAAYKIKDCGITVPQQVLPEYTPTINTHVPFATERSECDVNISAHHKNVINMPLFHNGEYTELSFAPFFCVYIRRDVYDESLGLDAQLGRHYRSDMIYCNYVREVMGYKIYHVSDSRVYHKLQKSTTVLEEESNDAHDLLFKQNRWSEWEQKQYGFKQAKWDIDNKNKDSFNKLSIKEYTPEQIRNIAKGLQKTVTIIIPIYNAFEETQQCIKSVIEHTTTPYDVLLINDCSPDERIKPYLDSINEKYSQINVIHSEENHGFVTTVNIGLKNTDNDVILLNSDTIVTSKWLQKLKIAAYTDKIIGTVTPVSNNAGAFSVPIRSQENKIPDILGLEIVSSVVEKSSKRLEITSPTGNGFCLYIKRDVIEDVGYFDDDTFGRGYGEENDFCMRALRNGWTNSIDETTYIYHKGSSSFSSEAEELCQSHLKILNEKYPDYPKRVGDFLRSEKFNNACKQIKSSVDEEIRTLKPHKRFLFVLHEGIGGTIYFTKDIITRIADDYDCYVLLSSGSKITLKHYENNNIETVKTWKLNKKWHVDYYKVPEFYKIYFEVLLGLNIDLVHIQHLVKHSYDILDIIKLLNIPLVLSIHDYYYICPSLNLLNEKHEFCNGKCNDNKLQCTIPIAALGNAPIFKDIKEEWQELNKDLISYAKIIICPMDSVKEIYANTYPEFENKFEVINHGQDLPELSIKDIPKLPEEGEKIKIAIPGNLGISKGVYLIKQIKEYDVNSNIEFHFLGNVHEDITKEEGIDHGNYNREDFNKIIKEINPSFIGIFSIWPETYCYTLNESWNMGVPVIATDIGALHDRIINNETGWLVDPTKPKLLYDTILKLSKDTVSYEHVLENIQDIKIKTVNNMVSEYKSIYKTILFIDKDD